MSGSLWLPPGARPETLPTVPRRRAAPAWAEADPIDELAGRLHGFLAAAVHPDEVAAVLESDGLSDDQIRERYGVKDSFALAEELYERVPRRHPEPGGPLHDPWRVGLLGCLLRGLVFALPGFAYVLAAPFLAGPKDAFGLPAGTVTLLAGALCGWTWNQGLSHRAYAWLGLGDRAAARRCLLVGAPAGALLGSLVALAATGPSHPAALAFAAGQSCYLGASTTLLVMGREKALLAALAPMAAGAMLSLAHPVPPLLRTALLLASLAAVMVLGLLDVRPTAAEVKRLLRRDRAGTPWLTASLPYALFGLGSGVLVLYAALGDLLVGERHGPLSAAVGVALTLSMGPAEWLLHRFRSGGLAALRSTTTPRSFRRTTARTAVTCLGGYLLVLLALGVTAAILWPRSPHLTGVRLAGLLLLGVVLWTGLLLQSFGAVLGAAAVCCLAALAQTAALAGRLPAHATAATVYGCAAAAQAALVCVLLGRVTAHR